MATLREQERFSRILVVEDNASQRATISAILEQEGFKPITASDAQEALLAVQQQSFGVAILDFRLPGINGVQLLERIKALNGRVRAIIHTGYGSFDSAKDAVNQGAFAYVEKGRDPGELLRHVHRAVQSHYEKYAADLEAAIAERAASLRDSEARYRGLVELCPEGIAIHDESGIIYANPLAAKLLGAPTPADLTGRHLTEFIGDESRDIARERLARIVNEKSSLAIGEYTLTASGGETTIVEIVGVFDRVDGRPGVQLLLRDLTERKRAEEERRLFDARVREAQKMETAGQLAAGIAHDFNNLLTVILGNSELLKDKLERGHRLDDRDGPLIDQIDQAGQRAAALTSRLLTFSRRQPVNLRQLTIGRVVNDLEDLIRRLLGETIRFSLTVDDGDAPIVADPSQLEQVILNFALNARDAMTDGGTFSIEIDHCRPDDALRAKLPELRHESYVRLVAADTGTGIPPETIERIFEPFFTTKPAGKGTGLGLASVYGIIHQAGGCVNVSSEWGVGTTFTVYWPVSTERCEIDEGGANASTPDLTGNVLVCEDDDLVRGVTRQLLETHGFTVYCASNAAEAMRICHARGREIDLLLSDILLPDLRGQELAERVLKQNPGIRVILMSGCATDDTAHTGQIAPGFTVLTKPFKHGELIERIRKCLSNKREKAATA